MATAVRLLLRATEPTAVAYGSDLVASYNDQFAAILGIQSREPRNGAALRVLCAALWSRIQPLVDAARHRGEAGVLAAQLYCRLRDGFAEEAYLDCACSPLSDDDGEIVGVVLTLADRTEQVLSARRATALRDVRAAATRGAPVAELCTRAFEALSQHSQEIPFALLYLRDEEVGVLRLSATAALAPGAQASPTVIPLPSGKGPRDAWPVWEALRTNATIEVGDLSSQFGVLPAGDWPFAPRSALVAPVTSPGREVPEGVVVLGVSARHALDASYRTFLEIMVKQVEAAMGAGRVHEDELRRAVGRVAARRAREKRRARLRAIKSRFAGMLDERTRLARELHDTLLQDITGISLSLRAVLPHVRSAPQTAEQTLMSILELAEKTSRDARDAVWEIRPAAAVDRNLARALEVVTRRLAGEEIDVRMSIRGRARKLSESRQDAVVRVVQEAVANIVRHAQARTIRLCLSYEDSALSVVATDDGRGFAVAPDFGKYVGHWGLVGMQERARACGGDLVVQSAPGCGTSVTLRMPYASRARSAHEVE